jgi:predicted pyridoxine 5'-phosphate oxidase superfamily flavin-nucleotide-binding protein
MDGREVHMSEFYHRGSRELQDRFDTRRLADRIEQRLVVDRIGDADKAFIESLDMFFLATTDEAGQPSCSYKGGDAGFVRVVDAVTLAFPNYDGNGMFLSMGNVMQNPRVGLLFIDFERQRRLRLSGEASISIGDPLLADYAEAQFIVRVAVVRVFPNCPRYIHKYQRVEASTFVPKAGCETPVPNRKKKDWATDVLAENDPSRSR